MVRLLEGGLLRNGGEESRIEQREGKGREERGQGKGEECKGRGE